MPAEPAWATRTNPDAPHDLPAIRRVAAMLGTPLMPWQQLAARIASERRPDGSWRYPVVVVTVPRQSGKTTLLRAVMVQRAMTRPDWLGFYTAQTGKDATARWKDLVKIVNRSEVLRSYTKTREAAGSPGLTWLRTESEIRPFAPTPNSLHGYTPPFVALDEAFSFTEDEGTDLLGAVMPAQQTVQDRQLWIISTKGPAGSSWFQGWVEQGRAATLDPDAAIAHIEYCAPAGADLYDPAVWPQFHPAIGHTITTDTLANLSLTVPPGEWARAFCNVPTTISEAILDGAKWQQMAAGAQLLPEAGAVGVGFDVALDRSRASLVAAWTDSETLRIAVLACAPGITWLPEAIDRVVTQLGDRARLAARDDGPARQITDGLEAAGRTVDTINRRDWATSCGALLWRANLDRVRHDGDPHLADAWRDAAHRPSPGGEGWLFDPTHSAGPIDPLTAATAAARAAEHAPTPAPRPEVTWG